MANPAEFPEKRYEKIHFNDPTKWTKETDASGKRTYTCTAAGQSFQVTEPGGANQPHDNTPVGFKLICKDGVVEMERP